MDVTIPELNCCVNSIAHSSVDDDVREMVSKMYPVLSWNLLTSKKIMLNIATILIKRERRFRETCIFGKFEQVGDKWCRDKKICQWLHLELQIYPKNILNFVYNTRPLGL